jgi:hypothetical protein
MPDHQMEISHLRMKLVHVRMQLRDLLDTLPPVLKEYWSDPGQTEYDFTYSIIHQCIGDLRLIDDSLQDVKGAIEARQLRLAREDQETG